MEEGRKILSADEKAALFGFKQPEKTADVVEPADEKIKQKAEEIEKAPPKEEVNLDFSVFEKKFGRKIEKEEELRSLFENADKYVEVETSKKDLEQRLAEYQSLAEKLDPLSHFANEDEYVRQQFLKKNKDKFDGDVINTLSTLSPSKIKNLPESEALKLSLMIEDGLTREEADAYLSKKYGTDSFDFEDMDLGVKAEIKVDAKNARAKLAKLYDGIDIPQKVDYETARKQVKESWEKPLDEIVKSIKTIKLDEGIDFVVTDEMKEGLFEGTLSELMAKQVKPSTEIGKQVYADLQDKIVLKNMDKVVKSMKADIYEQVKEELRKQVHNDKPLNESSRTGSAEESNDDKVRRLL